MRPLLSPAHDRPLALFFTSLRGAGIQRAMLNLAEGLLGLGVRVDLVVVQAKGELLPAVPEGARIVDLNATRALNAIPRLVDYLRREKPSAMLVSQTHLNLIAILSRALSGIRNRLIVSEQIDLAAAARNAVKWEERLSPLAARLFYRRTDGIIVVSRTAAEQLLRVTGLPPGLVTVIYNPIVTPALLAQAGMPVEHPWFQPSQPPVILSVGRLTRQKDQATLLRAFALLRQSRPARLVILGEGEERGNLERLSHQLEIQDEVSLPGFANNPFAYMAQARVFVLPSRWEGFANVLVEALACGAPVVSTDCPSGPAEILENGRFGRLAPVGDPVALAAAILQSMETPGSAEIGKTRAMDFALDHITRQYLEVLRP
jgi:glycosyltransferase involved in cell wall biosynthesis